MEVAGGWGSGDARNGFPEYVHRGQVVVGHIVEDRPGHDLDIPVEGRRQTIRLHRRHCSERRANFSVDLSSSRAIAHDVNELGERVAALGKARLIGSEVAADDMGSRIVGRSQRSEIVAAAQIHGGIHDGRLLP